MERWKDVTGYEGLYEVSTYGNVRNAKSKKQLRQCRHRLGYLSVLLYKGAETKRINTHRLVATAFLENNGGNQYVNHKDENKANNHVNNLEWCSRQYNAGYGTSSKRISEKRGHASRKRRRVVQMDRAGNIVCTWMSISEAARGTGTARNSIYECCNGIHKTANGFVWHYAGMGGG